MYQGPSSVLNPSLTHSSEQFDRRPSIATLLYPPSPKKFDTTPVRRFSELELNQLRVPSSPKTTVPSSPLKSPSRPPSGSITARSSINSPKSPLTSRSSGSLTSRSSQPRFSSSHNMDGSKSPSAKDAPARVKAAATMSGALSPDARAPESSVMLQGDLPSSFDQRMNAIERSNFGGQTFNPFEVSRHSMASQRRHGESPSIEVPSSPSSYSIPSSPSSLLQQQQHQIPVDAASPSSHAAAADQGESLSSRLTAVRVTYDPEKGLVPPSQAALARGSAPPSSHGSFSSGSSLTVPSSPSSSASSPSSGKQGIKDFQTLAFACQRAGKVRQEGNAYYKVATLYEHQGQHKSAIEYFQKYLAVAEQIRDPKGVALALNCIGIAHHALGGSEENLRIALEYHQQHEQLEDLAAGKFVASCNIGRTLAAMGHLSDSAEAYKAALQWAIKDGNEESESIALANLGLVEQMQGEIVTAKACLERQLQLSTHLRDSRGRTQALQQLGLVARAEGDFGQASEFFSQALNAAQRNQDSATANSMKVTLGMTVGAGKFDEYMKDMARRMASGNPSQ